MLYKLQITPFDVLSLNVEEEEECMLILFFPNSRLSKSVEREVVPCTRQLDICQHVSLECFSVNYIFTIIILFQIIIIIKIGITVNGIS